MSHLETTERKPMPDLALWEPNYNEIFYLFDGEVVIANYNQYVGLTEEKCTLPIFYIKKNHYKNKMQDIVHHMNYFTKFYDLDRDTYFAIMTVKYQIDTHPEMTEDDFLHYLMDRVITPQFIRKCKAMANDLYTININSDDTGKFKNTPKITNSQARQIVAISFCFRVILPLCIHFSNICPAYAENAAKGLQYLDSFSDIFLKIIKRLDYHRSCVSFIDGVVHNYESNYLIENYTSKPYEIDSADTSKDSDDSLSHAEALEMASYTRDASSIMISDCNRKKCMKEIDTWYKSFNVTDLEIQFYMDNCKLNEVNVFLLNSFYSSKFKDSYAILSLNKVEVTRLLIYMKKYLQYHKMPILAQILTANITGRYKSNIIKNTKFLESIYTSDVWTDIISNKFEYINELNPKENPIIKYLSVIINCEFEFVDMDPDINGMKMEDITSSDIAPEFLLFLSII